MNLLRTVLEKLKITFSFLNRTGSPSQQNIIRADRSTIGVAQQAGGDIYNNREITPVIEVSHESSVTDLARYDAVNIYTRRLSPEPLTIVECTFDGVPTDHASERLEGNDVFHFPTINREHIVAGYEPVFSLTVRTQTGRTFVFSSVLRVEQLGNRNDLIVLGRETMERL